ncbi:MAG: ATP-binding protein [Gammaproteobacteria bacterium]
MQTKSLSFRLLASEGLVLAAFFALVSVVLERSFLESAEEALKERLQVQVYSLLSAAELDNSGQLTIPPDLPEPRFANPGSGLYGFIQQDKKRLVWQSPSAIGLDAIPAPELVPGGYVFQLVKNSRYAFHYRVIWQNVSGVVRDYIFTVAEDSEFVSNQVTSFNETLRFWLLIIGIVLIVIQLMLLRWSLKPLRIIGKDLEAIEKGKKDRLDGYYATELQGLAANLNALISSERAHLERYRNTLADLAHSLKTPLAILHGCVESFQGCRDTVQDQIGRMNQIVEYQLQKAAAKGEHKTIKTADVTDIIRKITGSLAKVYIDKHIRFELTVPDSSVIRYEEGDLYEIIGNLLDNACKWCRHSVSVNIEPNVRRYRRNYALLLTIEDDGPGIPMDKLREILKRGVRADENIQGHGIGMAVVNELIALLGGRLEGVKSRTLGGMCWTVFLP